jgi:hypothetical protein
MRRRMSQARNPGKAIEVRLEGEIGVYFVILAGMTIHLRPICMDGFYHSTRHGEFVQIDNDTYNVHSYATLDEARKMYQDYVTLYQMRDEKGESE